MQPYEIPPKIISALRSDEFAYAQAGQPTIDYASDPLGCGGNGCVFGTLDKNVVVKLTSDSNEHEIASKYKLDGLARYYKTARLPNGVFSLWRESCNGIGTQSCKALDISHMYASELYEEFYHRLPMDGKAIMKVYRGQRIKKILRSGEEKFRDRELDRVDFISTLLFLYRKYASKISGKFLAIGEAMLTMLDDGWIMADAHIDNIGYVVRGGKRVWVIFDPGHCFNILD